MDRMWSVSGLKSIGTCGKQFWFKYYQDEFEEQRTPPLAFGSAIHKVIEILHKDGDKWEPGKWQRLWDDHWTEHAALVTEWAPVRKPTYAKLGWNMLSDYVEKNRGVNVLASELGFTHTIGDYQLRGVIDQVRRMDDGSLMVVDFKTTAKEPDPIVLRTDIQWTVYWDYARQHFGEDVRLAYYHLKSGKLIETKRFPHDLDLVLDMLQEGSKRVEQEMFARNLGYHCAFCPFKQVCLAEIVS